MRASECRSGAPSVPADVSAVTRKLPAASVSRRIVLISVLGKWYVSGESLQCKLLTTIFDCLLTLLISPSAIPVEKNNGDLIRENSRLRDRLNELEVALMLSLQDQVGIQSTQGSTKQQKLPIHERMRNLERIGVILDDWNLGVVNRQPPSSTFYRHVDRSFDILEHLPDCATSTYIVNFTLETLGWIHCAISTDKFVQEHELFQNCLATGDLAVLENHGWMAIYFSLLTVCFVLPLPGIF